MPARRRAAPERKRSRKRRASRPWWLLVLAVVIVGGLIAARLLRVPGPEPRRASPTAVVDVFFVRYTGAAETGTLAAVHRTTPAGDAEAQTASAVRALLAGPSAAERRDGLVSEVPRGTSLRGLHVAGGTATVDLSGSFAEGGGSASMLARVWQVVYTATQTPGVKAVQITLDGRRVRALGGEGVMVDAPIERPASMPAF
jgi:spore germination protein GerM